MTNPTETQSTEPTNQDLDNVDQEVQKLHEENRAEYLQSIVDSDHNPDNQDNADHGDHMYGDQDDTFARDDDDGIIANMIW